MYLDYQTREGDMDGRPYTCTDNFTVWKAIGCNIEVFGSCSDENNIQHQSITYCLKGYGAKGRNQCNTQ